MPAKRQEKGQMKKQALYTPLLLASILLISLACSVIPASAEEDGKAVFLKYKCDNCHAVSTAGIVAKTKSKAPDLVDVTVRHEKDWIRKYIRKKEGHVPCNKVDPSRDGKLHMIEFKGTQAEEDALIKWLDQQRSKK